MSLSENQLAGRLVENAYIQGIRVPEERGCTWKYAAVTKNEDNPPEADRWLFSTSLMVKRS